jgi:hypothetical protein
MRSAFPASVTMAGSEITGPRQFETLLRAFCSTAEKARRRASPSFRWNIFFHNSLPCARDKVRTVSD